MTETITRIKISSLMSDNVTAFCRSFVDYLQRCDLGVDFEYVGGEWYELEEGLDQGEIHMAPICGLGYIRRADREYGLELMPSAVMSSIAPADFPHSVARYGGEAVYFSHLVVHQESKYQTLDDLAGKTFASNEPGSHSGYNLIRAHLYDRGLGVDLPKGKGFFGQETISGAHRHSMELLIGGTVDAATIDSTVLEAETEIDISKLRIIDTLGPSAIPPMVISEAVPKETRELIRQRLLSLHEHAAGKALLDAARMERFVDVAPADYESIWAMAEKANRVTLASGEPVFDGYEPKREYLLARPREAAGRPPVRRLDLNLALDRHARHLNQLDTEGDSERMFMAGAVLREAYLDDALLRTAVLENADLTRAHLAGADLVGARLCESRLEYADLRKSLIHGADLTGADLSYADLSGVTGWSTAKLTGATFRGVTGLQGSEFARNDVTGTTLPTEVAEFTTLNVAQTIAENARRIFLLLIVLCGYAGLTVATTTDTQLRDAGALIALPILDTAIPVSTFYVVAPIVLLLVSTYFHLTLRRLWTALAALPAIFPDGKTLDERAYPWMFNSLIRRHFALLGNRNLGDRIELGVAIGLGWLLAPATIAAGAVRYLRGDDRIGLVVQVTVLLLSVVVAWLFYRSCEASLAHDPEPTPVVDSPLIAPGTVLR